MKKEKYMSELSVGESGVVAELLTGGSMRRRFLDLGLIPGTRVVCIGKSPMGDPRAYLIRDKCVAIRARDAKGVVITHPCEIK